MLCRYCNKECKNKNSHRNHERLCKNNPNRQYTIFSDKKFQKTNSGRGENQYTKAKRLGVPAPIVSDETRQKISQSNKKRTKEWHTENGKKISQSVQRKVEEGTWHTSLAKHMNINYNGVNLHGSWELAYAKYLDEIGTEWIRNKDSFSYEYEGRERKYTPDFYLPKEDVYIEIKGYMTEKDKAKWSQFPKHRKLIVLMEKELKDLNLI